MLVFYETGLDLTFLSSLAFAFRMGSEISQLCLEALSPLTEQCAKNQEKDSPLFIATRHFLKVSLQHKPQQDTCRHSIDGGKSHS